MTISGRIVEEGMNLDFDSGKECPATVWVAALQPCMFSPYT